LRIEGKHAIDDASNDNDTTKSRAEATRPTDNMMNSGDVRGSELAAQTTAVPELFRGARSDPDRIQRPQ
jgi:hypothetical protein